MCRHMWITNVDECTYESPAPHWWENKRRAWSSRCYRERRKNGFFSMEYDYDEALLGCHLWPHTAVFTGLIFKPHSLACCGILVFNAISKQEIDR